MIVRGDTGLAFGAFLGREPLFMVYPPISPAPNIG
jgi:hypothetical protein